MTTPSPVYVPTARYDPERLGPAMTVCTEKMRNFVFALVHEGGNATRAYLAAGYTGEYNNASTRANASTLAHNPRVLKAIKEEAEKMLHAGALLATSVLMEILNDPLAKVDVRAKVAQDILNRAGLQAIAKQEITVTDERSVSELKEFIISMAQQNGLDPNNFIQSQNQDVIDTTYTEVQSTDKNAPQAAPEDEPFDDLSDL